MMLLAGPVGTADADGITGAVGGGGKATTTTQCGCGMQYAAETGHSTADCVTYGGHDRDMECRPNGHAMLYEDD